MTLRLLCIAAFCQVLHGCAAVAASTAIGALASVTSQTSTLPPRCKPQIVQIIPGIKQTAAPYWVRDTTAQWRADRVYYATFTADDVVKSKVLGDFVESRRRFVESELQARGICSGEVRLFGPNPVNISDGECGIEHALVECAESAL